MFATYLVAKFAGETVLHNFFAKYIVPVRVREKRKEKNGWAGFRGLGLGFEETNGAAGWFRGWGGSNEI
jgi:hypothetical protein